MLKLTWILILCMWAAMAGSAYANNIPQGAIYVDAATYMQLVGDLRHFRDFHASLLILCDRKDEDSLCPPKPTHKPAVTEDK